MKPKVYQVYKCKSASGFQDFRLSASDSNGFTLLEVLLGVVLVVFISVSLYALYSFAINVMGDSRARIEASAIANERIERVRNLPYDSVGTVGGIPPGTLPQRDVVVRNNREYTIETAVFYIDDPFDGTLGGSPHDTLNTDYKRVRVSVSWPYRLTRSPVVMLTDVAPKGVESTASGGTLKVSVLNSYGQPVSNAAVRVTNTSVSPAIDVTAQTNTNGLVILPGAPPSNDSYQIVVTKSGYSNEQTRSPSPSLPAPALPPLSVLQGQTSSVTFSIDLVGTINVNTRSYPTGDAVGNVSFRLSGAKSLGNDSGGLPVPKYLDTHSTDLNGFLSLSSLEWDSYTFSLATSTVYDLAGIHPFNPVILNAGSTTAVSLYVAPKSVHSLLVAVRNAEGSFLDGALVQISRTGFIATSTTPLWGQVFFRDLESSSYHLTVTKGGYQDYAGSVAVSGATQEVVTMAPL